MKFYRPHTLREIASIINRPFVGNDDHLVVGINEIHRVIAGDLVFVDHPKYYDKALSSNATTILIDKEVDCPEGKALIISPTPFDDFNALTRHFVPEKRLNATIGENCLIAESAIIYPGAVIGNDVKIGANTVILPGAVIGDRTEIGEEVIIGPNTVLGHSAFYYKRKPEGYNRMYTCGNVVIEDRVEIGALCTIDAGVTADTRIGEGTKIDNQVHVGHDTIIGKNCLLAANVGLAGCVVVQDRVTLWGQVGCASDVTIGEGAIILAQSGIAKSLEGGKTYFGSPCGEVKMKFRELAALRKLPSILEQL
jgi:UDP-3-O-[3-hydroxymyristoyl] glucosamine N-acyltransferase